MDNIGLTLTAILLLTMQHNLLDTGLHFIFHNLQGLVFTPALSLILLDFYLEFERNQVGHKSVNYGNYEDIYFMFTKECMEEM